MIDWQSKNVGKNGDILLFELGGRLDAVECDYLLTVIEEEVDADKRKLIIDCGGLEFISSMGLGMLVRVHGRMKRNGGDVKLTGIRGVVADAVRLVRFDKILHIYPSVEEAIESYSE